MAQDRTCDVLIVGAGPTGSALALFLAHLLHGRQGLAEQHGTDAEGHADLDDGEAAVAVAGAGVAGHRASLGSLLWNEL